MNHSYSQNAPFDKWKQYKYLALSWTSKVKDIFSIRNFHQSKTIKSWSGSGVIDATLGVLGRRDAEEVEAEGTKTRAERNEKGSSHPPQPQAWPYPLLNKEGSAICDWFLELFSERRVLPCQDSTPSPNFWEVSGPEKGLKESGIILVHSSSLLNWNKSC